MLLRGPSETKKRLLNWAAGRLRVTSGRTESEDSVLPGRSEERLGGEGEGRHRRVFRVS